MKAARKIELQLDENSYIMQSKESFSKFMGKWFINHYQNREGYHDYFPFDPEK